NFWQNFVNKQVTFRFMRQELQFNLSQSLFSSADVDIGSRFLLRTIAQNMEIAELGSVLDIGCGVGVLGLSLKKINPNIQLVAQDRDALAATFTAQNAVLNELDSVLAQGGLAFDGIGEQQFDLIVSNLPGKAGHAVLQDMLHRMPAHLSETGLAAVVVVKPLAELVAETLTEMESELLLREEASGYEVFHFKGGTVLEHDAAISLTPYIRNEQPFKLDNQVVEMQTAWNLPEFDSLAHDTMLAINALKNKKISGNVLFWNPGQGHMPVFLRERLSGLTLAGRDGLSLQIAEMNLRRNGVETAVSTQHVPHFLEASGQYDWLIIFPDIDPGISWENYLLPHCTRLLAPGGRLLLVAKSAYTHRLLQKKRGLNAKFDRKRNGYRAVILAKA
ncbi:MAG: methyltransferase, partial [Anaerolineae bacterium]|nr:methyltransferase [Anaerolineae bacterium]